MNCLLRLVLVAIVVAVSSPVLPIVSPAQMGEAASCRFVLGFKALHDLIPETVGDCTTNERYNPSNGDALQDTARGMLVWRKSDNFTAFTDGYRTWVNGPYGVRERLNTQRFSWESDALPSSSPPNSPPISTLQLSDIETNTQFVKDVRAIERDLDKLIRDANAWNECCDQAASIERSLEKRREWSAQLNTLYDRMFSVKRPPPGRQTHDLFLTAFSRYIEAQNNSIAYLQTGDRSRGAQRDRLIDEANLLMVKANESLTELIEMNLDALVRGRD